jgi:leucyl-tRNA synthetase
MPQWAGSCWYYLRFLDPKNSTRFCDPRAEQYWMGSPNPVATEPSTRRPPSPVSHLPSPAAGVDLYIGGVEHAVLHLLYSRFWHKVLFDLGHVSTPEPFSRLVNQGLILGEDGQKMSKARGNVFNPDDILKVYGADALRLFEMFMGPLEMVKPWSTRGVEGVYRFLGRVWRLFVDEPSETAFEQACAATPTQSASSLDTIRLQDSIRDIQATPEQLRTLHACIKKVTEDLEGLRFNTALSALMVFVNEALPWTHKPASHLAQFLILLQPFAPHLAEELWSKLRSHLSASRPNSELHSPISALHSPSPDIPLAYQPWPTHNPVHLLEDTLEIPVQINGKVRDRITVPAESPPADLEQLALAAPKIQSLIAGNTVRKVIVVPGKLVNIVVA